MKSQWTERQASRFISSVRAPVRTVSAIALPFERNPRHLTFLIILLLLLAFAVSAIAASRVEARPAAPTFTVNSPFDAIAGGDLTNGVCETAPGNGVCTLRAAVMKANRFPGGGVTINIPSGAYTLTIAPASPFDDTTGSLDITQTTTIVGAGMDSTFVDGGGIDRVFLLGGTVSMSVNISNLTVRDGNAVIACCGGIVNEGNLTLNNRVYAQ